MYSHVARSETRSFLGFRQYCLTAKLHLTPEEMELLKGHGLRRIEIFYDPIRDELDAQAERAHERAKAQGWFAMKAKDASAVCMSEISALVSTMRALLAFKITVADLLCGVTMTHRSLQAITEIEQVLIDYIDRINKELQSARSYADETEDIFAPGTDDHATVSPNQWPRSWVR